MTYPCGIIKDLLPLYIDDVCSREGRQAVESHLEECVSCRACYEAMREHDGMTAAGSGDPADLEMAESLKRVKKRIHKRVLAIVLAVVLAAAACMTGYHLLFVAAVKDVPLEDVTISANVYFLEDLIDPQTAGEPEPGRPIISNGEDDDSTPVAVRIPEIGGEIVYISKNAFEEYRHLSIITVNSNSYLEIVSHGRTGDTVYISAIKTTLLNSTAPFNNQICSMEFGEINRIVFVEKDGSETVLWSR